MNKTLTVDEVEKQLATFNDCNYSSWRETPYDPAIMDAIFTDKKPEIFSRREHLSILLNEAISKLKRNKKLSWNQQKCFNYFVKDKSISEISKIMSISAPTVLSYLDRVFGKIKGEVNLIFLRK